ncbi:MAG: hypothetical protein ACRDJC_12615, partial [Thermomicrobiales bacterium]
MDAPLDLYRASREELIALVVRQREQIADLERQAATLQAELVTQRAAVVQLQERVGRRLAVLEGPDGDDPPVRPTTMPGLKPAARAGRPNQQRRANDGRGAMG